MYCGLGNTPDVAHGFVHTRVQYVLADPELKPSVFYMEETVQQEIRIACAAAAGIF